ncbi:MAG: pilus assembly protein [Lachnospiraceae bacterium]|nr:pilus assembly protein [Lachnospiraceae bacterium]
MKKSRIQFIKGSITVEAAFCLPIFLIAVLGIAYIIKIIGVQNEIQLDLYNNACEYAINQTTFSKNLTTVDKLTVIKFDEENEKLYTNYVRTIPFFGLEISPISIYIPMRCSSYEGESMVSDSDSDEYVYIGDEPEVYHKDINCTYLKPSVNEVYFSEIENLRNQKRNKYYPCPTCSKGVKVNSFTKVTITHFGLRYHVNSRCKEIYRNIKKVRRSEVGNLPGCSKCS